MTTGAQTFRPTPAGSFWWKTRTSSPTASPTARTRSGSQLVAEADGLREHRRRTEPGDPVQGLGAGPERVQAEPGDRRLVLVQQRDLLGQA